MTLKEIMYQLESWKDEKRAKSYIKINENYSGFGVTLGNLRKFAKKLGKNHSLALSLLETNNTDAKVLSCMMFEEKQFSKNDVNQMISYIDSVQVMDEFIFNSIRHTEFVDELENQWISLSDKLIGRAGWSLAITKIVSKKMDNEQLNMYLEKIEKDIVYALPDKQWQMNRAMCEIGIHYPAFTNRCIILGEKLGMYRNQKVSNGCTSAYAPSWIAAGIKIRENKKIKEITK